MDITTETVQAILDDAWDACPLTANSLRDQLRTFEKGVTKLFSGGSLASVAKNNSSQAYRGPGVGSHTPVQIANAWRKLINLFDQAKNEIDLELTANDTQKPPDDLDPSIYARMQQSLVIVDEYQPDITDLLLPPTLSPPVPFTI